MLKLRRMYTTKTCHRKQSRLTGDGRTKKSPFRLTNIETISYSEFRFEMDLLLQKCVFFQREIQLKLTMTKFIKIVLYRKIAVPADSIQGGDEGEFLTLLPPRALSYCDAVVLQANVPISVETSLCLISPEHRKLCSRRFYVPVKTFFDFFGRIMIYTLVT